MNAKKRISLINKTGSAVPIKATKAPNKKPPRQQNASKTQLENKLTALSVEDFSKNADDPYEYDFLLDRIFLALLSFKETDSKPKKLTLPPPVIARVAAKKSLFSNFQDVCAALNRSMDHAISFFNRELASDCAIDQENRLVIRGKFMPRHIENVLKKYVVEFVLCRDCNSSDTLLEKMKDTRTITITCNSCSSERVVGAIKQGYQSLGMGERRAARAGK